MEIQSSRKSNSFALQVSLPRVISSVSPHTGAFLLGSSFRSEGSLCSAKSTPLDPSKKNVYFALWVVLP